MSGIERSFDVELISRKYFILPDELADRFGDEVIITIFHEPCLILWSRQEYEEKVELFQSLSNSQMMELRPLFTHAQIVEIVQRRVHVSQALLDYFLPRGEKRLSIVFKDGRCPLCRTGQE